MARQMTGAEHGSVSVGAEPTPINAAPVTPPVEATLRILLNSVPFLMGVAVVRQPPANDAAIVQVGRMPWLHDRRLTTLSLPDDALPANRALALDWPVPYQAEWVGAPPRLLIARLVAQGHTVGVLLGTFITREQLAQHTREALDLACELIASAMAGEAFAPSVPEYPVEVEQSSVFTPAPEVVPPAEAAVPESEPKLTVVSDTATEVGTPEPETPRTETVTRGDSVDLVVEEVRKSLEDANDARSLGRILRDVMNVITDASAFSISLFHVALSEVAYRYKVLGPEADASELGRQGVDDGPSCYAARHDRRWHVFQRDLAIRDGATVRHRDVTVLQIPLVGAGEVFGVMTVQTFRADGFSDHELRLIAAVAEVSAPRFGQVRLSGRFQPSASNIPTSADAAAVVLPAATAARPTTQRTTETILAALLRRCAGAGFATAFLMGVDPGAGMLRGEHVSDSDVARELDYALGITAGKFAIPIDERYNAIARAMREARIVPAPTIHEIAQPALDWQKSLALERLAQGGRTITLPIVVESEPAGALVLGPMADDPTFSAIEIVRGYVEDATRELAELWRAEAR